MLSPSCSIFHIPCFLSNPTFFSTSEKAQPFICIFRSCEIKRSKSVYTAAAFCSANAMRFKSTPSKLLNKTVSPLRLSDFLLPVCASFLFTLFVFYLFLPLCVFVASRKHWCHWVGDTKCGCLSAQITSDQSHHFGTHTTWASDVI